MRVTTKGQVTIPVDIRRRLELAPGDEVEFVVSGDEIEVRKATRTEPTAVERRAAIETWLDGFADGAEAGWTTDDILDMTRGRERRDLEPEAADVRRPRR